MKQVLIIDASPMFREFLTEKLTEENVAVETANGHRDAFTKLISLLPDLVILDIESSVYDMVDFFEKKQENKNTEKIPIIISGPTIQKDEVSELSKFGVVKYFNKPIKFDLFFESIGRILNLGFSIDITPCVLEIHLNKNIVFVEIAQGLNREKIALLKYKLSELLNLNRLNSPKVILMMTDLHLSFIDGANLELLLNNVLSDSRIEKKNVKVLSLDSFTKELIDGHEEYAGIEVVTNLSHVLNSVIEANSTTNVQDIISDHILSESNLTKDEGSVEMRFFSDSGVIDEDEKLSQGSILNIALIDDDAVVLQLLENTLKTIGAKCDKFDSGTEFLQALNMKTYNLVILDIFMPGLSGFDILKILHERNTSIPVIVYSQAIQKDSVVQSLSLGAKHYLVKPQKPDLILKKVTEVLHGKF